MDTYKNFLFNKVLTAGENPETREDDEFERRTLKALTDHLGRGSRVGSFDPY